MDMTIEEAPLRPPNILPNNETTVISSQPVPNQTDAITTFDKNLECLSEVEKAKFLEHVQVMLKKEEKDKEKRELEKRRAHLKNESKEYQEEHEKKLRKCLGRYYSYVSRCKSLKGFRPDLTWIHPHEVEDELETYHLDEFDEFMKRLRKAERPITSLEAQYFPGVITCYPEDITEFFEKRWKRIKKSFVSAKNNICNCFKRSTPINQ
ncbi:hypothetical protein CRE_13394 [Caenorhabditis remanei]|uniref:Uncharacterized protein n=1 Tax=Caenorhabditis remanei TaxID=31234 RepID=E3M833_CAERE|nr:hypothetical protein CRE_13394 [Caenorhabditis remanei]